MEERIRELRKVLGFTQQKFADFIGVKRNTVAQYEMGRNQPIDSVINLICKEFSVNKEWLLNGTGEMFKKPDDEVGHYVEGLLEYSGQGNIFYDMIIEMMKSYETMDEKSKTVIREYFKAVQDGLNKKREG